MKKSSDQGQQFAGINKEKYEDMKPRPSIREYEEESSLEDTKKALHLFIPKKQTK